ncbi:phage tail terminator protein [Pseudomonas protegens]|uniref:phage tail terminator protein n=1 Tax=Pseudomonas protegens TaxID=380021 RepID=UPI0035A591E2
MKITPVYTQVRTHCPSFSNRVVVGTDMSFLGTADASQTPAAHVVPLADIASRSNTQNATSSTIRDRFEVVLLLDATDPQQALDQLHDLRAELWRALVGFKPGTEYNPIQYDGGELVSFDATRLLYRLRFFAEFQLGRNLPGQPAETWHERELDGLPSLTGVTVRVDAIDPADPNLQRPGPDGRLELTFSGELKQ